MTSHNNNSNTTKQSYYLPLLAGASSGIISTTILQPFDVIKTTMINPIYTKHNVKHILYDIYKQNNNGLINYWRGLTPALVRITIGSSIYFTTQTKLIQLLQDKHDNNNILNNTAATHHRLHNYEYMLVGGLSRGIAVAIGM